MIERTPPESTPNRSFSIRSAIASDLPALVTLERRCFAIPWSEEALAADLTEDSRSRILIATSAADLVIGYVGCWMVLEEGQINNIAVDPDWRRMGVARTLIQALFTLGRTRGIRQYLLEVRQSNHSAKALYRSLGFSEIGSRSAYYSDNGEDAIIMCKKEE
jgi:ribosomal-protein-alanine N-acetyltransferase